MIDIKRALNNKRELRKLLVSISACRRGRQKFANMTLNEAWRLANGDDKWWWLMKITTDGTSVDSITRIYLRTINDALEIAYPRWQDRVTRRKVLARILGRKFYVNGNYRA